MIPVDERPAVAATTLAKDDEHRRWLTTVATAIDAPPGTSSISMGPALILVAILVVLLMAG